MTDPSSFMHSNEPPGRHGPCYKIYDHDQLGNSLEGLAGMILLELKVDSHFIVPFKSFRRFIKDSL